MSTSYQQLVNTLSNLYDSIRRAQISLCPILEKDGSSYLTVFSDSPSKSLFLYPYDTVFIASEEKDRLFAVLGEWLPGLRTSVEELDKLLLSLATEKESS